MTLSAEQLAHYRANGWVAPVDVMTAAEAARLLLFLEEAEAEYPNELHAENRNNPHLSFPFLAELVQDSRIVDAAAQIVGNDISLWSTVLFVKEPSTSAFVSWHQDAKYLSLAPDDHVTAWLALTSSTIENGCVSVIPETHRDGEMTHDDTFRDDNILTRGQEVPGIDESSVVHLELQPGQMSLHHPWLVHGSQPNRSNGRRVGIAMQTYMGADVRPLRGTHFVTHIRGAQPVDDFKVVPPPSTPNSPEARSNREAVNQAFADILYDGAKVRRKL
ncbi:MAG: non-heme Fe2+,alpha-ketoglutarate-dependent halogenase [Verrucomicrobiales bacterium]|jgi:non-heme Fe2+,alpha-ketoglutarate-dependent halogenase